MSRRRRVLLGQLGASGDCVYATTVARQIKADDPSCHLTWAIGPASRQVIDHNPDVDAVWTVDYARRDQMSSAWARFEGEAREKRRRGEFDDVYFTQIYPSNFKNFDGTVRASIFRGYPRPITVPVTPVIRVTDDEVERVSRFAAENGLTEKRPVILLEATALSGQSPMTGPWANELARKLVERIPDAAVVMNSGLEKGDGTARLIDASVLGFREIAILARYCSLLIGCSSGVTWLLTSDAAPKIPTIQVLSSRVGAYGAVVHDLDYWRLPSDHVIELHDCSVEHAAACAIQFFSGGLASARAKYHEDLPLRFNHYFDTVFSLVHRRDFVGFASSLRHTVARYGPRPELIRDFAGRMGPAIRRRLPGGSPRV